MAEDPANPAPDPPRLDMPIPFTGRVGKYRRRQQQQFGAPRRFGIGTVLIVMAAASLLLAVLIAWGAHPVLVLHIVGFTTLIGFAQVFLFKGKDPRKASLVAGGVICPVYVIGINLLFTFLRGRLNGMEFFCTAMLFVPLGPLFGYLAGGIVGGIFLLMDAWEKKFGRQDLYAVQTYDPFAPEPISAELIEDDEELRCGGDGGREVGDGRE